MMPEFADPHLALVRDVVPRTPEGPRRHARRRAGAVAHPIVGTEPGLVDSQVG
jgi:hypothetical protein